MTIQNKLSKLMLVAGAMVAPMAKAETKLADTQTMQQMIQDRKTAIPAWIPTTLDGKFDEKKANEQAEMLWQEHGTIIQQYANAVKDGVPEEIAFTQFAYRLANGDKEKEKQILSLYDAVKKTRENDNNDMRKTTGTTTAMITLITLFSTVAIGGIVFAKTDKLHYGLLGIIQVLAVTTLAFTTATHFEDQTDLSRKHFVETQRVMYNTWVKQNNAQKYSTADRETAKKIIQMAQGFKEAER